MPGDTAPLAVLEERLAAYQQAIEDTRRFIDIARTQMALAILDRAPDVPPEPGDEMPDEDEG